MVLYFQILTAMASGVTPRLSMNGQANGHLNGTSMNKGTGMSLPEVDADKLKARLYSYAPQQSAVNHRALRFNRPTNSQLRKSGIPSAPRLEPLVSITNGDIRIH